MLQDGKFMSRSQCHDQGHGGQKVVKYGPTVKVNGSLWWFSLYEFLKLSPGRNGAGIFYFFSGARSRHIELGLSAKCRVHFLGRGSSNGEETWYVGRGR